MLALAPRNHKSRLARQWGNAGQLSQSIDLEFSHRVKHCRGLHAQHAGLAVDSVGRGTGSLPARGHDNAGARVFSISTVYQYRMKQFEAMFIADDETRMIS